MVEVRKERGIKFPVVSLRDEQTAKLHSSEGSSATSPPGRSALVSPLRYICVISPWKFISAQFTQFISTSLLLGTWEGSSECMCLCSELCQLLLSYCRIYRCSTPLRQSWEWGARDKQAPPLQCYSVPHLAQA